MTLSLIGVVLSSPFVDKVFACLFRDEFVKHRLFAFAFAEDASQSLYMFPDAPAP